MGWGGGWYSSFRCPDIQLVLSMTARCKYLQENVSKANRSLSVSGSLIVKQTDHLFQDLWIWRFQLHRQPKCGGDKDAPVELRLIASRQKCLQQHFWPEMPSSTSPGKSMVISTSGWNFQKPACFYSWNIYCWPKVLETKPSTRIIRLISWKLFLFLLILFTRNTKQTSIGVDKIISMHAFFCLKNHFRACF